MNQGPQLTQLDTLSLQIPYDENTILNTIESYNLVQHIIYANLIEQLSPEAPQSKREAAHFLLSAMKSTGELPTFQMYQEWYPMMRDYCNKKRGETEDPILENRRVDAIRLFNHHNRVSFVSPPEMKQVEASTTSTRTKLYRGLSQMLFGRQSSTQISPLAKASSHCSVNTSVQRQAERSPMPTSPSSTSSSGQTPRRHPSRTLPELPVLSSNAYYTPSRSSSASFSSQIQSQTPPYKATQPPASPSTSSDSSASETSPSSSKMPSPILTGR